MRLGKRDGQSPFVPVLHNSSYAWVRDMVRTKPRTPRLLVLLALAAALAGGCTKQPPPNVLLIVIDTLRPDRLGAYGSTRGLTPFLDSLAQRGFVFRNAYAQSSWTNASIASLFTSRYQSQHRITSFTAALSPDEVTLAEVLAGHGFVTGGFSANFLVGKHLGFGQGFADYETYTRSEMDNGKPLMIKERAERINREGLAWLDQPRPQPGRAAPVLLYLHYMEPHNPYDPPAADLDRVLAGRPAPDRIAVNRRMRIPNLGEFPDDTVQAVKDLYDAEVMSVDAQLRVLFEALGKRGFLDRCIVVVAADHGEEFREHGLMGHHQTLYEEVIRVPLIVLVPGHEQRVDVTELVSLTDVAPTLLDLLALPQPPEFEGHSLRRLMGLGQPAQTTRGPAAAPVAGGTAFSELIKEGTQRARPHERAVITDASKLILDVDGKREFYDLRADPGETNTQGLVDGTRERLSASLQSFMDYTQQRAAPVHQRALDAETRERMRALGYQE